MYLFENATAIKAECAAGVFRSRRCSGAVNGTSGSCDNFGNAGGSTSMRAGLCGPGLRHQIGLWLVGFPAIRRRTERPPRGRSFRRRRTKRRVSGGRHGGSIPPCRDRLHRRSGGDEVHDIAAALVRGTRLPQPWNGEVGWLNAPFTRSCCRISRTSACMAARGSLSLVASGDERGLVS